MSRDAEGRRSILERSHEPIYTDSEYLNHIHVSSSELATEDLLWASYNQEQKGSHDVRCDSPH